MDDLAYKRFIGDILERIRALEMSGRPAPYNIDVEQWQTRSKWAEREAQEADDLVELLDTLIAQVDG